MTLLSLPADPNALRALATAIDSANDASNFANLVNPKLDQSMTITWRSHLNDPRAPLFAQQLAQAIFANWDMLTATATQSLQDTVQTAATAAQAFTPIAITGKSLDDQPTQPILQQPVSATIS